MFPKIMKLDRKIALFLCYSVTVASVWIFSAFFQTSFVGVIPPNNTCFLRFDSGTVILQYYSSPVWLSSTVACSHTFQTFRWSGFYYIHDPARALFPHFEVLFPIWLLLLPVIGCALLTTGRTNNNQIRTPIRKRLIIIALMFGICLVILFAGDFINNVAPTAVYSGNLPMLRFTRLLGIDIRGPFPQGPLIVVAARGGQQKIIRYLLSEGVDIESKDNFGDTALSRAAQYGRTDTVRMLIAAGANPNVYDLMGGNTPMDLCYYPVKWFDPAPIIKALSAAGGKFNIVKK